MSHNQRTSFFWFSPVFLWIILFHFYFSRLSEDFAPGNSLQTEVRETRQNKIVSFIGNSLSDRIFAVFGLVIRRVNFYTRKLLDITLPSKQRNSFWRRSNVFWTSINTWKRRRVLTGYRRSRTINRPSFRTFERLNMLYLEE